MVHVLCVAVEVSFVGARITPDGRAAVVMSARTVRDLQVTGLNRQLRRKMIADLPDTVTEFVFNGDLDAESEKVRSSAQSLYVWVSSFKLCGSVV